MMRVFFSGIQAFGEGKDAPDFYVPMANVLGEGLAGRQYGGGLDCWFLLFVFMRDDGPGERGKERMLYRRQSAELDLRLFADHEAWRRARTDGDRRERNRLLWDVASRSFDIMRKKRIIDFDVDAFQRDVEEIAREQRWSR